MCAVPSLASGHLLLTIINDILDYSKIEVRQRGRPTARAPAHSRTQAGALWRIFEELLCSPPSFCAFV
jgi:signal transduction histidine kinase